MKKTIIAALAASAIVATLAVPGFVSAKRPSPSSQASTISINQADPSYWDVVTFSYSTPVRENCNSTYKLCFRIQVVCSQDGAQVYEGDKEAYQQFLLGLGTTGWDSSSSAECSATLYYWDFGGGTSFVPLASTSFAVAP